jgi:hypothetical protein
MVKKTSFKYQEMKDINKEVQKTLESWDKPERYEGNPFLYTRIEEEIRRANEPKTRMNWTWQPILVAVLIAVNVFTIATALVNQSDAIYDDIASQYDLKVEDEVNNNYFLIN